MSPAKPTREDALGAGRPEETGEQAAVPEQQAGGRHSLGEGRESRGGAADNQRHPPHVTENFEDSPMQDERPGGIEPLPANASGTDTIESDPRATEIDPESMYDRRPAEDKDAPPSQGAG